SSDLPARDVHRSTFGTTGMRQTLVVPTSPLRWAGGVLLRLHRQRLSSVDDRQRRDRWHTKWVGSECCGIYTHLAGSVQDRAQLAPECRRAVRVRRRLTNSRFVVGTARALRTAELDAAANRDLRIDDQRGPNAAAG